MSQTSGYNFAPLSPASYVAPSVVADAASYGSGTTDATTYLQGLIDGLPDGGWLHIPKGSYKLTAALTVSKNATITGAGVAEKYGSRASGAAWNEPISSPYLYGTVLLQTTAAVDGLTITGSGIAVNLEGFGVAFSGSHMLTNTGHGINVTPPANGGGLDHGVFHAAWRDLAVFGHDGNHYGFRYVNGLYNTWQHLRSFGGGGFWVESNSDAGNYGNLTASDTYASVVVAGTAHGYRLRSGVGGGLGQLTLCAFIRPQSAIAQVSALAASASTPPTNTQRTFSAGEDGYVSHYSVLMPDFECPSIGSIAAFTGTGQRFVDTAGQIDNTTVAAYNNPFTAQALGVTGLPGAVNPARLGGATASGPPTSGTWAVDDVVPTQNGNLYVCTAAGTPGTWAEPTRTADLLITGEETRPREWASASSVAHPGNQIMWLTYFKARKTETAANVRFEGGNTAAGATPTLVRIGLFTVASNDDITLVASTANDTTLFNAAFASPTKAFSASVTKQAGQRYALGLLIVSGAAMPTMYGNSGSSGALGRAPMVCSQVTGLADLPSSVVAASQSATAPGKWFLAAVTP